MGRAVGLDRPDDFGAAGSFGIFRVRSRRERRARPVLVFDRLTLRIFQHHTGIERLNFLGAAEYSKSSLSDIDTVTSPALSFTTLKSHDFSHALPCSASGNVGKMPPYTISQS